MNNNCHAEIVKFNSKKDGSIKEAVQISIKTSQGIWKSGFLFPTPLEFDLVKKALNPMKDVYEETDNSL